MAACPTFSEVVDSVARRRVRAHLTAIADRIAAVVAAMDDDEDIEIGTEALFPLLDFEEGPRCFPTPKVEAIAGEFASIRAETIVAAHQLGSKFPGLGVAIAEDASGRLVEFMRVSLVMAGIPLEELDDSMDRILSAAKRMRDATDAEGLASIEPEGHA